MSWRHEVFLQHGLHPSKCSLLSLHFHMCTSSCPQDVEMIFQLHPCMLHHSNINCLHNHNYPYTKCGKIWNRDFVDIVLDVFPTEKIQGGYIRGVRWPGDWSITANPSSRIQKVPNMNRPMRRCSILLEHFSTCSSREARLTDF